MIPIKAPMRRRMERKAIAEVIPSGTGLKFAKIIQKYPDLFTSGARVSGAAAGVEIQSCPFVKYKDEDGNEHIAILSRYQQIDPGTKIEVSYVKGSYDRVDFESFVK